MAQAFIYGDSFIGDDCACLVLGDYIFYGSGVAGKQHEAVVEADQNGKATVWGNWVKFRKI